MNVRIEMLLAHAGQLRVMRSKKRHRVVRCGRRWGKSRYGIAETCEAVTDGPAKVGWFIAQFKFIDEIWADLSRRLAPLIVRIDNAKHRMELRTGAVIEVWSLEGKNGKDAGRGRDYDLIIVDEAGLVPWLRRWWSAVAQATLIDRSGRALFLSTPNPIGPDFDEFFEQAGKPGAEQWEAFTGATFDNEHLPEIELDNIREQRKHMPDWLWQQEYLGIPADAAAGFFGRAMLDEHRAKYAMEPLCRVTIDVPHGFDREVIIGNRDAQGVRVIADPDRGCWSLWIDAGEHQRPDQTRRYGLAVDVGAGVGSSNTVFTAIDLDDGRKVGEFVSPLVGAEKAAELAMIAAVWFGGKEPCVICPEVNGGQGQAFARMLLRLGWPAVFGQRRGGARHDSHATSEEPRVGWTSTPTAKLGIFTELRAAMATGKMQNPSHAAIDEAQTYSFDKNGRLVPFRRDVDPAAEIARMPHGDRTVADAIAWHIVLHTPKAKDEPVDLATSTNVAGRLKAMRRSASRKLW